MPIRESSYAHLVPRNTSPAGSNGTPFESRLRTGADHLPQVDRKVWRDRLAEFRRRKSVAFAAQPAVSGLNKFAPLGPTVVLHGQAQGDPPVGGRVSGIAVAPGGQLVYAASANGGVFRSDDAGATWHAMMDGFDIDPQGFATTSLACGAIAIDLKDPRRVYVGTGEGDASAVFNSRLVNALPAYRGIGPLSSDDGGQTWTVEQVDAQSPELAGEAFFALAVDPNDRDSVIAATTAGLYRRSRGGAGPAKWSRVRAGLHCSVCVASAGGVVRFLAAEWGSGAQESGVVESSDGITWKPAGQGLPSLKMGRIALGVRPSDPNVVYAFAADADGALHGLYRLDRTDDTWKKVRQVPDVLPAKGHQGDYDLAIAVDPEDASIVYLGGSFFSDHQYWPASIWRCNIEAKNDSLIASSASIGTHAHADVHVLIHAPQRPNSLWAGCDGGVFLNRDPRASGMFGSRNTGLACLCCNFFAQHPTDPGILFCGLQDNGTARTSGSPMWENVGSGDGGYCVVNWADPKQVLIFSDGIVSRATDGGLSQSSWADQEFPWALMTEPIITTPYNPANPNDAKMVALGSGRKVSSQLQRVVYISSDFGATWSATVAIPTQSGIYSMAFASATRLFVGTTGGEVFRVDRNGSKWVIERIDNVSTGELGVTGLVSDLAIDWADSSRQSVYAVFGGMGDYRHVWHFDGVRWEARSGPAGSKDNLLDVEHNAMVVDPIVPTHLYVGADVGVWQSIDSGKTWQPLSVGLPDAPVFDLQIHPVRRLLRAATHGRGMYEYRLKLSCVIPSIGGPNGGRPIRVFPAA
ncbi:MAG TPA: hypothetical protein VKT80_16525 [Chloroflexota bacterium]|nr:hypothetical protein [Chloroflexota bacterium]